MCKSYGSLAQPKEELDIVIRSLCHTTSIDFQVVDKINENTDMMTPAEQETIFNSLNAIKVKAKDIILNHAEVSNFGIEVLSEALKHADSIHRLDLSHITHPIGKSIQ